MWCVFEWRSTMRLPPPPGQGGTRLPSLQIFDPLFQLLYFVLVHFAPRLSGSQFFAGLVECLFSRLVRFLFSCQLLAQLFDLTLQFTPQFFGVLLLL